MLDKKETEKRDLMNKIDSNNKQMKSKKFDRYTVEEKARYIDEQIELFEKLKPYASFFDKIAISGMIIALHKARKNLMIPKINGVGRE